MTRHRNPKYRHYKPKNLGLVVIDGKAHYLGRYDSPESWEKYHRLLAGCHTGPPPKSIPDDPVGSALRSIDELLVNYWDRRVVHYYVNDGRPTSEQDNIRQALRFLRRLYGQSMARDFGPLALKAVRQSMIEAGRCRRLINQDVHRIRAIFRWAAGEELYPGDHLAALAAVEALRKGRSAAKDRPPINPVDESVVLATLPHLSPQVAAMVRLQLLTAARLGEVAAIRPRDLDRSDSETWVYRPESHKTQHHGRERVIVLGPRARAVLGPWLGREPDAYCFARPRSWPSGRRPANRRRDRLASLVGRHGLAPRAATPRTATGWRWPGRATGLSPIRRSGGRGAGPCPRPSRRTWRRGARPTVGTRTSFVTPGRLRSAGRSIPRPLKSSSGTQSPIRP